MSAIIWEWKNAKDERLKKYYDGVPDRQAFWEKKIKEGIIKKVQGYSDNFGTLIGFIEFENAEKMAKLLSDEEFKVMSIKLSRLVDNCKMRVMTPAASVPPE